MGQLGRRCTIQVDGRRLEVSVLAKDYVIVAMGWVVRIYTNMEFFVARQVIFKQA